MLVTTILLMILMLGAAYAALAWTQPKQGYEFDQAPDEPVSFGQDMSWLAIKTDDPMAVCQALGLVEAEPANWQSGTSAIYEPDLRATRVFVSPAVDGWVLVAGLSLPHPQQAPFVDKCRPMLARLGAQFPDVQYFANDTVVDLHAWARVVRGRFMRGYAVIDTSVVWSDGAPGNEERELGLSHFEIRGVENRSGDIGGELLMHPRGEHVLALARRWSINPTELSRRFRSNLGTGYVASAPRDWRVERVSQLPAAA